ncbi:MAG: shikimate kinase [Proteobacteria bacterium]|nr:shikimate kinase [Pseudomonadota bacterium]
MQYVLPIVLIGPMSSGKSTVAKILEQKLGIRNVPLDMVRWYYYFRNGYSIANDRSMDSFEDRASYWKRFDLKAVERVLQDFNEAIVDFGAGHSYYPDEAALELVKSALSDLPNVFLLIPSENKEEALEICEARIKAAWPNVQETVLEYNKNFIEHKSNIELAKKIVITKEKTPEEVADEIISQLH